MSNKLALTAVFISMLLLLVIVGKYLVNLGSANPWIHNNIALPHDLQPPSVTIMSPENNTIQPSSNLTIRFNVHQYASANWSNYHLQLINYNPSWQEGELVYRWTWHSNPAENEPYITDYSGELDFTGIPEGKNTIVILAESVGDYTEGIVVNEFCGSSRSSIVFTVLDTTPPHVSVLSIENMTDAASNVQLNFTVNEPTSKTTYSLDGQNNVTVVGNTTLTGLSNGEHNITVYTADLAGNAASSEITFFMVDVPEAFPTLLAAVATGTATVAVASIGSLLYFRKHGGGRNR